MVSAQTMVPQAFWTALNNQNLNDMATPQWSIVVNGAGIQCSLFFENPDSAQVKSADSSGICSSSPVRKGDDSESKGSNESFTKNDGDDRMETIEINKEPAPIAPIGQIPGLNNLPFLQQYLANQMLQNNSGIQGSVATSQVMQPIPTPQVDHDPKPVPGDLMLISQENRRRLINLREEAQANRLSVTAFIRRGALLYFDSDELAMNRLHTLDQKRLGALELETKYYFGDIPQQLFRRTIAIQQSQIRSKKSANSETRVRFRPNNGFNINGINFNSNSMVKNQQDLSAALTMAGLGMPQTSRASDSSASITPVTSLNQTGIPMSLSLPPNLTPPVSTTSPLIHYPTYTPATVTSTDVKFEP